MIDAIIVLGLTIAQFLIALTMVIIENKTEGDFNVGKF